MSWKVKRGLGLLVVAAVAWFLTALLVQSSSALVTLIAFPVGLVAFAAVVAGVGLLAWGLLRD